MTTDKEEEFNWYKLDSEDIVFNTVRGVAVFLNVVGEIAIVQQNDSLDDDVIISFPIDRAAAVIEAIKKVAQIA